MATSQDLLESALAVSDLHGDLQAFPYLYAAFQTEPWNTQHAVNCAVAIYRGIISHKFPLHNSEGRVLAITFAIDCFAWAEMRDPLDDLITDNADVRRALENMLEQEEEAGKHMKSKDILPKPRLAAAHSIPRAKPLHTWLGDTGIPFNSDGWNLYSEGRLLFEAGWFDEASVYFSAAAVAASDDPASSLFYAELGLSQLQVGKCAAANASFSSAIDRSSHFYKEIFVSANVTSSFMFNISASLLRSRLQTCENKKKIVSRSDQEQSQDEDWKDVSQAQMIAESSISMEFDDMGNQQTNSHYSMTVAEYLSEKGRMFDLSNRIETNSTLREALQKYERMHGSILENFRRTGSSSAKFLVVQLSRALGIGNRLLILIGAFLLSLLTERALLVHWPSYPAPLENMFALPPGTAGIFLASHSHVFVFTFPFVRPWVAVEWSYYDFMAMLTPTNLQKVNISKVDLSLTHVAIHYISLVYIKVHSVSSILELSSHE